MRRLRALGAIVVVTAAIPGLASGCKKKKEPVVVPFDAAPPPDRPEDVVAKDTVKVIARVYPPVCDASAATRAWTACRETTVGYDAIYACAQKSAGSARAALASLRPSTDGHGACAQSVRKAAVELLNATPGFFGDLVTWLRAQHDKLHPLVATMSLADACRSKSGLCAGEPHDWDSAYAAMRVRTVDAISCTASLFTCGQSDTADCAVANIVPRLGIACPPTPNRSGASPDDLLFVRGTGTPLGH